MKQTDRIRKILDEIDASSVISEGKTFSANFSALELPDLICSVSEL